MKYEFSFTEINYGSVAIESDTKPTRDDVMNAIMEGNAFLKDTEYNDIQFCGTQPQKSKPQKAMSR